MKMVSRKMFISVGLLSVSTLTFSALPPINLDIMPIPKSFIGKWAGLHSTDQKLNEQVLRDLCDNGGDSDTAYFVEFSADNPKIQTLVWWVTLSNQYLLSYSQYSTNHISGKAAKSYSAYDDNEQEIDKFDFEIINDKLYDRYEDQAIELWRCDKSIEVNKNPNFYKGLS